MNTSSDTFDICSPITQLLKNTVAQFADQPAILESDQSVTFTQFDTLSDEIAQALIHQGIRQGDRVALYCINGVDFAAHYIGIVKAGGVVVPINLLLTAVEIAYILNDSEARALIYHSSLVSKVKEIHQQEIGDLKFVSTGSEIAQENDLARKTFLATLSPLVELSIDPAKDLVCILYTSGTTGKPKGAMLTHRNLSSNTTAAKQAMGMEAGVDRILVVLPMFHAFAATVGMLLPLLHGCAFIPVSRFEPKLVADTIAKYQASIFLGVPSMYNVLLQQADLIADKIGSLKRCISGGAAMPQQLLKNFEDRFGIPIFEGDGPTECSPVTCINPLEGTRKTASVGLPIPGVEMAIMDANGDFLPCNTIGEICVRAPSVMAGYWKRPEATAESFFGDWFRTGDLGNRDDDGYFYIVDRIKDMIIVNGMNVYPRVVEEVLYQHSGIREAAVIGEPDDLHGEIVVAYIATHANLNLTAGDIRQFCRDKLGRHQIPKKYHFISELPKNAAGKTLKRELRKHGELERGIDSRSKENA